jgi:hypothetical protein
MRAVRRLVPISMALAALAGCGGGDGAERLSAREIAACLKHERPPRETAWVDVKVGSKDLDIVAADAGEAGILVEWIYRGGNTANIAVERSDADAENTERAYEAFGEGFGINLEESLIRRGNVVVFYDKTPDPDEARLIDTCIGGEE